MGPRHMDYPSPRGVHVPETFYSNDPDDPYRRTPSRRNRYSRSVHQTPRVRDVAWISSPDPTTQTLHASQSPWRPPQQMPSSPTPRPPSAIPPSPVPTVGEHMTVDEIVDMVEPYPRPRPQRPGLIKSFWKGLKKLSGFEFGPSFPIPRRSWYEDQTVQMPMPGMRAPSEATQYVDPTSSGTETEQRNTTPYGSPYARPATVGGTPAAIPSSLRASPVPSMTPYPSPYTRPATVGGTPTPISGSLRASPVRSTTPYASSYTRRATVGGTPAVISGSLRTSPVPAPSFEIPPPITVISPSNPSSPRATSTRSARAASPRPWPVGRKLSVYAQEPGGTTEEGSHTLHEPIYPAAAAPVIASPIPISVSQNLKFPLNGGGGMLQSPGVDHTSSKGSLASTMARVRRFVSDLDGLPWVSDAQIADEYVPDMNPRSRLRTLVRQGAEPSWYNPRPEVEERPAHLSEWDMWAKQSTAALQDVGGTGRVGWPAAGVGGGMGQGWGAVYPHGYVPAQQPGYAYPSGYPPLGVVDQDHAPVIPSLMF